MVGAKLTEANEATKEPMTESHQPKTKQLNFNTVLIFAIGALISFGIKKMDEINTEVVKVGTGQSFVVQRLDGVERKLNEMVLQRDFQAEITRLNREVEALKNGRRQ